MPLSTFLFDSENALCCLLKCSVDFLPTVSLTLIRSHVSWGWVNFLIDQHCNVRMTFENCLVSERFRSLSALTSNSKHAPTQFWHSHLTPTERATRKEIILNFPLYLHASTRCMEMLHDNFKFLASQASHECDVDHLILQPPLPNTAQSQQLHDNIHTTSPTSIGKNPSTLITSSSHPLQHVSSAVESAKPPHFTITSFSSFLRAPPHETLSHSSREL